MRILFYSNKMSGGGAERQLGLLLHGLKHYDLDFMLLTFDQGFYEEMKSIYAIRLLPKTNIYSSWIYIIRLLKEYKPNFLFNIIPAGFTYTLIPTMVLRHVSLITGMRSIYTLDSPRRYIQLLFYLFSKGVVSNVHPDDMKSSFQSIYRLKKGAYIPNATEPLSNKQNTLTDHSSIIKLLYAGRLIKDKNLEWLIKAMSQATLRNRINLTICGEGEDEMKLKELIATCNLEHSVTMLGYRKDLHELFSQHSALVLPSVREGMPNVAFEAANSGLPLLLSDIKAHKRWFKHKKSAWLLDTTEYKSLTHGIDYISNTENRQSMVENAYVILGSLSPSVMVEKYYQYFGSLIRN